MFSSVEMSHCNSSVNAQEYVLAYFSIAVWTSFIAFGHSQHLLSHSCVVGGKFLDDAGMVPAMLSDLSRSVLAATFSCLGGT